MTKEEYRHEMAAILEALSERLYSADADWAACLPVGMDPLEDVL